MATEENLPQAHSLSTDELARCTRRLAGEGIERRYLYVLCRDRSVHGGVFFYLKTHVETWQAGRLAGEDFSVSPLAAGDGEREALCLFERIAGARSPVAPVHLGDVLRDLTLLAAEAGPRWQPWHVYRGGAAGGTTTGAGEDTGRHAGTGGTLEAAGSLRDG